MKGLVRQKKLFPHVFIEPPFDQGQIEQFIRAIKLVPHQGMPEMGKVNPDLMLSSRLQLNEEMGEFSTVSLEPGQGTEVGDGEGAVFTDSILDGYRAGLVRAQREFDCGDRWIRPAMYQGFILLANLTCFPDAANFPGRLEVFGNQDKATRFPIQTIDKVGFLFRAEVEAQPGDQTGHFIPLGRMTDQIRRLVHHQQVLVLINDLNRPGTIRNESHYD